MTAGGKAATSRDVVCESNKARRRGSGMSDGGVRKQIPRDAMRP